MLSVRIPKALFDALRRAALERKIQGQAKDTHAEIVQAALTDWLKREGHLK